MAENRSVTDKDWVGAEEKWDIISKDQQCIEHGGRLWNYFTAMVTRHPKCI